MFCRDDVVKCGGRFVSLALVTALVVALASTAGAQTGGNTNNNGFFNQAVGGIAINPDGVLKNAQVDDLGKLSKMRGESMEQLPGDLSAQVPLRKLSLHRLEVALEDCAKQKKPLPDTIRYLAGLQRIQYVFVYPEQKDIVLVGPAEGWHVDGKGNVVGLTTGRPVMMLDDLLVALRTAKEAAQGGITCSIDPTAEGRERVSRTPASRPGSLEQAQAVGDMLASALGMQRITIHGVPGTSHFARVLVAADYRMKRFSMELDPSPVRGLPSYLGMLKGGRISTSPRFWLEPKYDALLRDANGLAYCLNGSAVKAMSEDDYFAANGAVQHSGKANPIAQKWADIMTEKYPQLALADPVFGQLQNCMDLAVVGALIVKERLPEKAGASLPTLLDVSATPIEQWNAPKETPSLASVAKHGRSWIITASGGVAINSWGIADKVQPSADVDPVRAKATPAANANWWWN
jgi:hypothetical protein